MKVNIEPLISTLAPSAHSKPPPVRDWFGARTLELGRWSEVLRPLPVPAGWIVSWHWDGMGWIATDRQGREHLVFRDSVICAVVPNPGEYYEAFQMAFFIRHPDTAQEQPPPVVCEDQYEVLP